MSPPPVGAATGASVGADPVTEAAAESFPAPLWYEVGEEGEGTVTVAQALRALALRFTGWCLWYGKATGRWWALSPTWCRERVGLVEADTAAELAARMRRIEDFRPQLIHDRHERPSTTDPTAAALSRHEDHGGGSDKGTTSTEFTDEGGN